MTHSLPYQVMNDPAVPQGGVALVSVPAAAHRATGPIEVVIERNDPDEPYLGPNGWQTGEFRWWSGPVRSDGVDLLVPLGDRITGQIEDYTPLRVILPTLGSQGGLVWEGITPASSGWTSARAGNNKDGNSFSGAIAAPHPQPAEPAAPKAEPARDTSAEITPPAAISAKETATVAPTPEEVRPLPAVSNGSTIRRAAMLLVPLLIAAGLAAGWLLYVDEDDGESAAAPPAPASEPLTLTLAELHERGVAAAQARNFAEARQMFLRPEREDYGPTLLYLARAMDSVDFVPGLMQEPNDIRALQLYAAACTAGEAAAREDLGRLEPWMTERANSGDIVSREALRLEMPKARAACS